MPALLHIITGLDVGGAETALSRLVGAVDRDRFPQTVLSLTDVGEVGRAIAAQGVTVAAAGLGRGGLPGPRGFRRLGNLIAAARPDLVQCWMYHANLLGGLAARRRLGRGVPQIWGVRQTELGRAAVSRRTAAVARVGGWLSHRIPAAVVFNAEAARRAHVAIGYDAARSRVIPNGFDTDAFRPDAAARASVRAELGIAAEAPVVGLIGRWDPQKDHATFLAAAAQVRHALPAVRFVLAGTGVETGNPALAALVAAAGLDDACHLLGHRRDMAALTAAFDVACSSSFGEGFANAIGEAMACGVPCAVTAAGDSAAIVADTGRAVPPRDSAALAGAILDLLRLPASERQALGRRARARVVADYSIAAMAHRFEALWEAL